MLEEIGSPDKVDAGSHDKFAKKEKIMGMGHAVYKVLDPRAPHLKAMAVELTRELGETKWVEMSDRIAEIVKKEKNLNANVDFYSATVYYSLGIPTDLFTPIFAIARTSGWTGHIIEQLKDNKIFRPSSEYVGFPVGKKVVPLAAALGRRRRSSRSRGGNLVTIHGARSFTAACLDMELVPKGSSGYGACSLNPSSPLILQRTT